MFNEWRRQQQGLALLPAGVAWDAVKLDEERADRIHRSLLRRGCPVGVTLRDSWYRTVYFLVPPDVPGLPCPPVPHAVTSGGWLAAPDPRSPHPHMAWTAAGGQERLTSRRGLLQALTEAGESGAPPSRHDPRVRSSGTP
ncbi:hypothetical protein [Streptomyces tropicalis]|uniref:DNA primase/polymerase bifunctional N-terminal domain-containing protein n=1 Tax=Streptomyces tropicalis TaxID=3034234 RepID=A0ABT6A211_9ACTN|nr:hypothetical protein [Streptomyces tropicalis]MDF3298677.1 hypothetical protein [Streptomyces tropicalis]